VIGTALVVSDGGSGPSATQKISFAQPFDPANCPGDIRILFAGDPSDVGQFEASKPDLLVLSRCTSERGSDWISIARDAHIPVVFHIDDDLLAVPESLGAAKHSTYNSPERLNALRRNIDDSDLLYVSTAELGKRFADHGITTPIVAGDIYCSVSPEQVGSLIGPATGPVIGYMGTRGHAADLAMVLPAICDVMEAVPGLQFELFGTIEMPAELTRFRHRVRHLPPVADYSQFMPYLRSLGWWVGLAPLEDNAFNRCKADTKWVEYSVAGMAVIASDLPVYRSGCADGAGVLAHGRDAWRDALMLLVHGASMRRDMIARAQQKLIGNYTHERLRAQVLRVFDQAEALARPELQRRRWS
jgi:hypothetical protein